MPITEQRTIEYISLRRRNNGVPDTCQMDETRTIITAISKFLQRLVSEV